MQVQGLGGGDRNRTGVQGFAGPCLNHSATPPDRRPMLDAHLSPPGGIALQGLEASGQPGRPARPQGHEGRMQWSRAARNQDLHGRPRRPPAAAQPENVPVILVFDDDRGLRAAFATVLASLCQPVDETQVVESR